MGIRSWLGITLHNLQIAHLKYKRQHCDHTWFINPSNPGIRTCVHCGSYQASFAGPYGGGFNWQDINTDEPPGK